MTPAVTKYGIDMYNGPNGGTIAKMVPAENGAYVLHSEYLALLHNYRYRLEQLEGLQQILGSEFCPRSSTGESK